jgi:hypothetical protein
MAIDIDIDLIMKTVARDLMIPRLSISKNMYSVQIKELTPDSWQHYHLFVLALQKNCDPPPFLFRGWVL